MIELFCEIIDARNSKCGFLGEGTIGGDYMSSFQIDIPESCCSTNQFPYPFLLSWLHIFPLKIVIITNSDKNKSIHVYL